ncbi:uncharacterized protein LOC119673497 [Teleopsis dalmanni]|uniref:uncharacterized protein LOC119673497 n=1 Tax=Teleopsis dalmanni TaxID=139649 RepID=UPI0018CEC76C|nr:uncharacterized protein LOC119673497 [Teleopsis dalmanni]
MLQRKSFNSIFKDQKYKSCKTNKSSEEDDFTISDCSSDADAHKKSLSQESNRISNTSDGENDCNKSSNFCSYNTPRAKRFKIQQLSARKKPLPHIKIIKKAKESEDVIPIKEKKILCANNTINKLSTTSKNETPFKKVQKLFAQTQRPSNLQSALLSQHKSPATSEDDEDLINWSSSDSNSNCSDSRNTSISIETPTTSSQKSNPPSELDLLLALIERENNSKQQQSSKTKSKSSKRCRKGGYLQQLFNTLDTAKTDKKFLEHDKKFGLRCGTELQIVELESSFGVNLAKVKFVDEYQEDGKCLYVVLDENEAKKVKPGSNVEAFFDVDIEPYEITDTTEKKVVFIQPHKILLLQ